MTEFDTRHEIWLDKQEKKFNQGGPCKHCQHFFRSNPTSWLRYCWVRECYVEANGPDYACEDFDIRREFE